jgi:tetratricopeptide (TPR) repeat protein
MLSKILFVLCLFLCPSVVCAQSARDVLRAKEIAASAKMDFDAGRFDAAAEKFHEAYVLSRKPATLFNAARAKQEAKKFADARDLFQIYKTLPKIGLDGYQEAEKRIAQCETELEKIEAAKAGPPPIVGELPKDPTPTGGVEVSVEATKVTDDGPTTSIVFEPRKLLSWQSGAAIALVGTGIGFMVSGASESSEANKLPTSTDAEQRTYQDAFSSARAQWRIGLGLSVAGASVAVWSVVRAIDFDPKRSTLLLPTTNGAALIVKF